MKKRTISSAMSLMLVIGGFGLVGCGNTESHSSALTSSEEEYHGDYSVRVTAIGSTTISESKTLQLRSSVTGTNEKNVTWSSSDETVAIVNSSGLVTGVSQGKATITASLNIEPRCKGSVEITVEAAALPTSLTIKGIQEGIQWVGDTAKLEIQAQPADASSLVRWTSSDTDVATVSEEGHLQFLNPGSVTITATSVADPKVTVSKDFTVKYGVFSSTMGSSMWDISQQAEENARVSLSNDNSGGYNSLYYRHVQSTKYYAEAFFKVSGLTANSWDWQGVGLGHGLNDSDTRFFTFSPHSPVNTANSFNKCIVRDMPTSWGALTNRSQMWGEHGLDFINCFEDGVKIATLRDGDMYYYLINDEVYYVDETTKYSDVPTYPVLVSESLPCTVTSYRATDDETEIDAILATEEFHKTFYPNNIDIVDYDNDSRIVFNSDRFSSKDNKVKYLGDKGKVVRNFEIEMDVKNMNFNSERVGRHFTGLTINLSRYDAADSVESLMIGRSKDPSNPNLIARYLSWDFTKAMEDDECIVKENATTNPIRSNATDPFHVKITRTIDESNKSNFKMFIDGEEVVFDQTSIALQERYTAAYLLWIGGEYSTCTVENFTLRSNIQE